MTSDLRIPNLETGAYGYGDVDRESMDGPGVWLRVPHRGALKLVLMKPMPFRYLAHWVRRGYTPCPGRDQCNWCALAVGTKPRYVYSVWDLDRKRSGLIEVAPETAAQIRDITTRGGDLPGTAIRMTKRGGVVNGAIAVDAIHELYRLADLPAGPEPELILRRQWSAPPEDRG